MTCPTVFVLAARLVVLLELSRLGTGLNLGQIPFRNAQRRFHIGHTGNKTAQRERALHREDFDLLTRHELVQLVLQGTEVMCNLDGNRVDQSLVFVPQQHVGGTQILTQHVEL